MHIMSSSNTTRKEGQTGSLAQVSGFAPVINHLSLHDALVVEPAVMVVPVAPLPPVAVVSLPLDLPDAVLANAADPVGSLHELQDILLRG